MLQSLLPRPRNPQAAWMSRRERSGTDEVCSDLHQTTPTLFHKGTRAEGSTRAPPPFTFPSLPRSHNLTAWGSFPVPPARQHTEAHSWVLPRFPETHRNLMLWVPFTSFRRSETRLKVVSSVERSLFCGCRDCLLQNSPGFS